MLLARPACRAAFSSLLRPWVCILLFGVLCALSSLAATRPAYSNGQKKLVQSAILPMLIVSTTLRPSIFGALLELPAVRWIGRLSYSLYLWQQLFLFHEGPGPPFLPRLPLIIGFAAASYYFIERPMIRLGRRIAVSHGMSLNVRAVRHSEPKGLAT
jgi:peptidoglycan/LPS O-acetylase OafA/YrhL